MSFGSYYPNPRRVVVHPYTGEIVICASDDGQQHRHQLPAKHFDNCEECGDIVLVCPKCAASVSCCSCGNYHSIDCGWPV